MNQANSENASCETSAAAAAVVRSRVEKANDVAVAEPPKHKKKARKTEREEGEIDDDEEDDEYENYSDDDDDAEQKEPEKQEIPLTEVEHDSYDDDDDDYCLNNKRLRIDEGDNVEEGTVQEAKNLENDGDFSSASSSVSAFSASSVKTEISVISSTSLPLSISTQKTEEEVKTPKKGDKLKVPPLKIICSNSNGGLPYVKPNEEAKPENNSINTRSKTGAKTSRTESPVPNVRTTPSRRNNINIGRSSPSVKHRPISPSSDSSSLCPANGSEPDNVIRRKLRSHTRQLQNGDERSNVQKSPSSSPVTVSNAENEDLVEAKSDAKPAENSHATEASNSEIANAAVGVVEQVLGQAHELIMGNSSANCIKKYLEIRNEVSRRRTAQMQSSSDLKLPKSLHEFLLIKKNYLIRPNRDVRQSIPFLKPPNDMPEELKELFSKQEKERYKLRLRHKVEQDKLIILYEQEILRCFNKPSRDELNQTVPLSFCAIIKDAEVYSLYKNEQGLDTQRPSQLAEPLCQDDFILCRLNEIKQKFLLFKNDMIKRQLNESDSLYAVQKMDFQSKIRDISVPSDYLNVPIVNVNNKFELFDVASIFNSQLQQQQIGRAHV